jgi:hypothetical protein
MEEMQATQSALEYLVLAQLTRLQKDHSRLESLYTQLPADSSRRILEERFVALWTDVDERAARLDRMLDEMASARCVHRMQVPPPSPSYPPAA